jgi:rRNA maturation protein Nop10
MITTGTTPTTFSPDDPVSRGQMATFLWRYSDEPEPASLDTDFTDVPGGRFYSKAVAWLVEQQITTGTTPTTFSPDDPVTRGQMATFLWRLAGEPPV